MPKFIDIDISLCLSSEISNIVFGKEVEKVLRETCLEIEKLYEIKFIEIGAGRDHVHFLVQSVPRK